MADAAGIRITEVGPRDGLQNESVVVPVTDKIAFIDRLSRSGPADPLFAPLTSHGPLSDVKTTSVCSSSPSRPSASKIWLVDQSISMITSP